MSDGAGQQVAGTSKDGNADRGKGNFKKGKNKKVKLFPSRVKTGAIEQKEIANLQERYESLDAANIHTFNDIALSKKTLNGLKENSYVTPTKVQSESICLALQGLDVLGAAKTGSGKTLAFVVPVLERLYCLQWSRMDGLGALVITPTRELAYQIFETFRKVGVHHDFSVGLIIGGQNLNFEKRRLDQCNIMICTPGRLLHHMDENPLFDSINLQILVIDEADRCLDLGFEQTMNGIIENLPPKHQTLLFSATQTKSVKDLARLSLKDPVYVSVHEHAQYSTPESLNQSYIICPIQNKIDVLWSFLKSHKRKKLIVFMTCCKQVRFLHQIFTRLRAGFSIMAIYGTMHQVKRMTVYEEFCNKKCAVLLATDIAARGLDFPSVDWVVQFDCPEDPSSYIHRAGRTARFEKGGESLLVLLPSEESMVDQLTQKKIPINKIQVNPAKMSSIQRKLEAMLARDLELKQMAQRAFVTYIKSIFLRKDKSVFDVQAIDLNSFARSLGLAVAPRVRFLQNKIKSKAQKDVTDDVDADDDVAEDAEWRRQDLGNEYQFHEGGQDSDSGDDVLTLKRKDHALAGEVDDEVDAEDPLERTKKHKILTKEKVAKRILRKKLKANQKVAFDEEGNRIFDASREKVSEVARAQEMDASPFGGIDLQQAKLALQEEDKFDKELHRQKVRAKHRELRLKAKEERRKGKQTDDADEANEGVDQGGSEDDDESLDGSVADIIDALPDPDVVYGAKGDDEEDNVYRGPPVTKKRQRLSDSEDDDSDEDDKEDGGDVYRGPPVARKRQQTAEDSDDCQVAKKKWTKKKGPKKAVKAKKADFDTGLDLALDEELALHLLHSKS